MHQTALTQAVHLCLDVQVDIMLTDMVCKISPVARVCLYLLLVLKPISAVTCGTNLSATAANQNIVATASSEKCVWRITATSPGKSVKVEFVANNMVGQLVADSSLKGASKKCVGDIVKVYDGNSESGYVLGEVCGKGTLPSFQSEEQAITVVFTSDSTDANRGFTMNYRETDEPVRSSRQLTADTKEAMLSSPSYPGGQVKNVDITWTFKPPLQTREVKLTFTDVDLGNPAGCSDNYIRVYIGDTSSTLRSTLCGKQSGVYMSRNGNVLTVVLKTDNNLAERGFKAMYVMQGGTDRLACSGPPMVFDTFSLKTFETPNYPNTYQNLADCQYLIKGYINGFIRVKILDAEFAGPSNCTKDYLEMYDGNSITAASLGRVCQKTTKTFQSTGNTMLVRFISDSNVGAKGAKISYTSILSGANGVKPCYLWVSVLTGLIAVVLAI